MVWLSHSRTVGPRPLSSSVCDNRVHDFKSPGRPRRAAKRVPCACHKIGARLVYLFGSQARGQAFPFSDVDFAIAFMAGVPVVEQSQRQVEMVTELMSLLGRNDVDVAVLERATPLLRHRAATEGIVLYQACPNAHADFLVQALREYDDTRSLREAQTLAMKARYGRC